MVTRALEKCAWKRGKMIKKYQKIERYVGKHRKTEENADKLENAPKNEEILTKASLWRHLGRQLGTFWSLLGALWVLLGALGALLERSWKLSLWGLRIRVYYSTSDIFSEIFHQSCMWRKKT